MWVALYALAGAYIYRMRGGMKPSFPRPIDQVLFSLPFGYIAYAEHGLYAGLLILAITTVAVIKGHGNNMDLGDVDRDPEWYEFMIKWAKPRMPLYWYDFLGLTISGLSYTIPAGIATLNPILAISGAFKAPAYALAKKAMAGTEGGELLTGALLWAVAGSIIVSPL